MSSKTITIREDVYNMLLSIKGTNESFSTFFERLIKRRSNIDKLKELRGSIENKILILVDTDVLIEIFDKNSDKGEAALKRIEENREAIHGFTVTGSKQIIALPICEPQRQQQQQPLRSPS